MAKNRKPVRNRRPPAAASSGGKHSFGRAFFRSIAGFVVAVAASWALLQGTVADAISFRAVLSWRNYLVLSCILLSLCTIGAMIWHDGWRKPNKWSIAAISFIIIMDLTFFSDIRSISAALGSEPQSATTTPPPLQTSGLSIENGKVDHANYIGADLKRSRLDGSTITDVNFDGANLSETDFRNTKMVRVNFSNADLCGADIRDANLAGAIGLDQAADLSFVLYDAKTNFPDGFDVSVAAGLVLDTNSGSMLYSCEAGITRQLLPDGTRK